jgi:hypothetical protein
MPNYYGPRIVTNGLVLCLDAANPKSYPGSGTAWTDLSGNRYDGTLTNGPIFYNINGGRIDFDGTNDVCTTSVVPGSASIPTNSFTYEVWCRPAATINLPAEATSGTAALSTQMTVIGPINYASNSGAGLSVGTNGICVLEHGSSYLPSLLTATVTISNTLISQIVAVYTNKQTSLYINGTFVKTGLTSLKTTVYADFTQVGNGPYSPFSGSISIAKVYSRALSATEIRQNYNTNKGRFKL